MMDREKPVDEPHEAKPAAKETEPDAAGPPDCCERCGAFMTEGEPKTFDGQRICAACVEHLGAGPALALRAHLYDTYAGRRDGMCWWQLLSGQVVALLYLNLAGAGLTSLSSFDHIPASFLDPVSRGLLTLLALLESASGVALFALVRGSRRWRTLLLLLIAPLSLVIVSSRSPATFATALALSGLTLCFGLMLNVSERNQLAFGRDLSDRALARLYKRALDNRASRYAESCAAGSLLIPFLELGALHFARAGLAAYAPSAEPPVGGRRRCQKALFIAAFGACSTVLQGWLVLGL